MSLTKEEIAKLDKKEIVNKPNEVIRKVLKIDEDLDLTTLSNEQLYKLFKPAMDLGVIIGYVNNSKVATNENNGEANTLNCGVMFPSEWNSDVPMADGGEVFKTKTLRFTLSSKAKVNNIICINPTAWAAISNRYERTDKETGEVLGMVTSTNVRHKSQITDDEKKLLPQYEWRKVGDKKVGLPLQGQLLSLYQFVDNDEDA